MSVARPSSVVERLKNASRQFQTQYDARIGQLDEHADANLVWLQELLIETRRHPAKALPFLPETPSEKRVRQTPQNKRSHLATFPPPAPLNLTLESTDIMNKENGVEKSLSQRLRLMNSQMTLVGPFTSSEAVDRVKSSKNESEEIQWKMSMEDLMPMVLETVAKRSRSCLSSEFHPEWFITDTNAASVKEVLQVEEHRETISVPIVPNILLPEFDVPDYARKGSETDSAAEVTVQPILGSNYAVENTLQERLYVGEIAIKVPSNMTAETVAPILVSTVPYDKEHESEADEEVEDVPLTRIVPVQSHPGVDLYPYAGEFMPMNPLTTHLQFEDVLEHETEDDMMRAWNAEAGELHDDRDTHPMEESMDLTAVNPNTIVRLLNATVLLPHRDELNETAQETDPVTGSTFPLPKLVLSPIALQSQSMTNAGTDTKECPSEYPIASALQWRNLEMHDFGIENEPPTVREEETKDMTLGNRTNFRENIVNASNPAYTVQIYSEPTSVALTEALPEKASEKSKSSETFGDAIAEISPRISSDVPSDVPLVEMALGSESPRIVDLLMNESIAGSAGFTFSPLRIVHPKFPSDEELDMPAPSSPLLLNLSPSKPLGSVNVNPIDSSRNVPIDNITANSVPMKLNDATPSNLSVMKPVTQTSRVHGPHTAQRADPNAHLLKSHHPLGTFVRTQEQTTTRPNVPSNRRGADDAHGRGTRAAEKIVPITDSAAVKPSVTTVRTARPVETKSKAEDTTKLHGTTSSQFTRIGTTSSTHATGHAGQDSRQRIRAVQPSQRHETEKKTNTEDVRRVHMNTTTSQNVRTGVHNTTTEGSKTVVPPLSRTTTAKPTILQTVAPTTNLKTVARVETKMEPNERPVANSPVGKTPAEEAAPQAPHTPPLRNQRSSPLASTSTMYMAVMTPPRPSEQSLNLLSPNAETSPYSSYPMSPYASSSDDEYSDEDDAEDDAAVTLDPSSVKITKNQKRIPRWACRDHVLHQLQKQRYVDPDHVFPDSTGTSADLIRIFATKKPRFSNRKDSGNWNADRLSVKERHDYRKRMGYQ